LIGLKKHLGFYGDGHWDFPDGKGALSTMVCSPDLPDEKDGVVVPYEYGRLHLLALGFYTKVKPLRMVTFSGLFKHGGTSPLSPPGIEPAPWAYRLTVILYPPEAMISSNGRQLVGFASLPGGKLLSLTPEMTSHEFVKILTS
jgi:hypothetical protein